MKWNYSSSLDSATGYEQDMDYLTKYSDKEEFRKLPEQEQKEIIKEYMEFYRDKNIFPITYFNDKGIEKEINRCMNFEAKIKEGNIVNTGAGVGTKLCNYLFPNLFEVESLQNIYKLKGGESAIKRFNTEKFLTRALTFALRSCNGGATPTNVFAGLRMCGVMPSNFRPMNAQAIYEKYCPKNGIIYDFAGGFGGRMLGALTSKNNYKYFCVEPCEETYNNLITLGNHIERVTNRKNIFKVYKKGSEEYKTPIGNYIDFAFSSPPYFNLEIYSNEESQSYNKYDTLDSWLENYVKKTIENIYYMLKPNCYYAVNIADFEINKNLKCNFVDEWLRISEECGFEYVEQLHLKLPKRTGNGDRYKSDRKEGIFVFKKPSNHIG